MFGSGPPEACRACILGACRVNRRAYTNFIKELLIFSLGATRGLPGLLFKRLPRE